ncbi:lipocalin-like domain-containing protein [Sphingomonas sp.]|uniref:lipocalin-like domain-containing protein n=1 Tax=Sphingomonas sp. TaxID=28214 RepID=UPI0035BC5366
MRALIAMLAAGAVVAPYPVVRPGVAIRFPADHGAHPDYRTEWWYVTGWLKTADGRERGFQVTFFRTRPPVDAGNPSRFAARQVLFAHAALSDPAVGHLLHGDRAAREGFGIAQAKVGDGDVAIRNWRMRRLPDGRWSARVTTRDFAFDLMLTPTQPPMLQGVAGYSRKGPLPEQASRYYSMPHLRVAGVLNGARVTGEAWLDREWSSDYLAPQAQGWDWTGINFDDGAALMAFRIRRKGGGVLWAGGSLRRANGQVVRLAPGDVMFRPLKQWRSAATGAVYPVAQEVRIRLPEGVRAFALTPLFPAQELDARRSGLPVYWEGAVRTLGGRGYLELTGYDRALSL